MWNAVDQKGLGSIEVQIVGERSELPLLPSGRVQH